MNKTYSVHQVLTNPRDGAQSLSLYSVHDTLAEAKAVARKELKNVKWAVTEERIVAASPEFNAEAKETSG